MPLPPRPADRPARALLLLFLLAREAGLPFEEVDGRGARALVVRGRGVRTGTVGHLTRGAVHGPRALAEHPACRVAQSQ